VEVMKASKELEKPSIDVIEDSKLLKKYATSYKAMYTHRINLHIQSVEEDKELATIELLRPFYVAQEGGHQSISTSGRNLNM